MKTANVIRAVKRLGLFPTVITITRVKANPKQPRSKAAARYAEMEKYVAANPGPSLARIFENTGYRLADYRWDHDHGFVTAKATPRK